MKRAGDRRGRARPCRGDVGLRPAFACPAIDSYSRIYNYSADAGASSQIITNLSESPGWRAALLGTVAAGALWLGAPRDAKAGPQLCTISGASPNQTATCQGNQSNGITSAGATDFDPAAVETLNVNTLTTDIMPAAGVAGIYFRRIGAGNDIVINSDTTDGPGGPFAIIVNGALADGIDAISDSAITIDHTGAIDASAGRDGIVAQVTATGTGPLSITSDGNVTGGTNGIFAVNVGTGALTVIANGEVEGTLGTGIRALNNNAASTGPLSITSEGVTGGLTGIFAFNNGTGALTIDANGEVEGTASTGIYARNNNSNSTSLSVTAEGVTGNTNGIFATTLAQAR